MKKLILLVAIAITFTSSGCGMMRGNAPWRSGRLGMCGLGGSPSMPAPMMVEGCGDGCCGAAPGVIYQP